MLKVLFFSVIVFFISAGAFAQKDSTDKQIMDSLIKNYDFLKMLNNLGKTTSYFQVSAGVGNSLLNGNDLAIKTLQNTNIIVFTPSVGYFHKSGFGVAVNGYLLNENQETKFYQYSLSPSYEFSKSKVINALVSYTHYFIKDVYNSVSSPVQNDFYGSFSLKKPFLRPGISGSYSSGRSNEIVKIDTVLKIQDHRVPIDYIDAVIFFLKSFSLTASLKHDFNFFDLFSQEDGLRFKPEILLNIGINTYKIKHNSSLSDFNSFTKKKLKKVRHILTQLDNQNWLIQSAGVDLDLNYVIGKFNFEPDLYLDYYLPKTSDNRFTQIYNLNIGMTF
ncbi:MAG TPA: hypothetical protein VMU83_04750 [Hanamia sp.]|nr:hypothetical protein [Hanamia sp.]